MPFLAYGGWELPQVSWGSFLVAVVVGVGVEVRQGVKTRCGLMKYDRDEVNCARVRLTISSAVKCRVVPYMQSKPTCGCEGLEGCG